jgi:hypothetical protein
MIMKNQLLILLASASVAGLATGCKPSDSADENPPATNSTLQTAKDDAGAALTNTVNATTQAWAEVKADFQSAMGYSYDQKDEFIAKTKADMQVLDQKIQKLSDWVASASDTTKADLQSEMQDLRAKRAVLDQKLANVQAATADNWEDAKAGFKNAYFDVKTSLQNAWHSVTS